METTERLKKCSKCGDIKRLSEYYKNKRTKLGVYSYCKSCHKSITNTKENRKKISLYTTKRNVGFSEEKYDILYKEQNGRCAICGINENELSARLCVDHCHVTGKIRGLLCNHCNLALGHFKDNVSSLKRALTYLEETNE